MVDSSDNIKTPTKMKPTKRNFFPVFDFLVIEICRWRFWLILLFIFVSGSILSTGLAMAEQNPAFGAHKPNYILPITWAEPIDGRLEKEAKFQLSIKQSAFNYRNYHLYFAYTQRSFWQVYDGEDSRPFRETNYNPEFFIRSPEFETDFGEFDGDIGAEHESNGAKEYYSRSWNRVYFQVRYRYDILLLQYKIWYRLPESEKKFTGDPEGDDNPDIHKYFGYSELRGSVSLAELQFTFLGRLNISENKGAVELNLSYPLPGTSMYGYLHYWNGYGESLIDYNRSIIKLGLGLLFVR